MSVKAALSARKDVVLAARAWVDHINPNSTPTEIWQFGWGRSPNLILDPSATRLTLKANSLAVLARATRQLDRLPLRLRKLRIRPPRCRVPRHGLQAVPYQVLTRQCAGIPPRGHMPSAGIHGYHLLIPWPMRARDLIARSVGGTPFHHFDRPRLLHPSLLSRRRTRPHHARRCERRQS